MSNPEGLFVSQPDLDLETAVAIVKEMIFEDGHEYEDAFDIAVFSTDVDEADLSEALRAVGLPRDLFVSAVLAQIEDLTLDDQIEVLNEALMRQEVAPID